MNIYNIEEVDYDKIHDLEFYIYDDYIQFSNESKLHVLIIKKHTRTYVTATIRPHGLKAKLRNLRLV